MPGKESVPTASAHPSHLFSWQHSHQRTSLVSHLFPCLPPALFYSPQPCVPVPFFPMDLHTQTKVISKYHPYHLPLLYFNISVALVNCRKGPKSLALALVSLNFFLGCEVYSSGQFEPQSGRSSTHTPPSHAPSSPLPGIPPFIFPCLNVNVFRSEPRGHLLRTDCLCLSGDLSILGLPHSNNHDPTAHSVCASWRVGKQLGGKSCLPGLQMWPSS